MKYYLVCTPFGLCTNDAETYKIQDGILTLDTPNGPAAFKDWQMMCEISEADHDKFLAAQQDDLQQQMLQHAQPGGEA